MNGKRAKRIRKVLSYKKTPNQLVERGGLRDKDGKIVFAFARNPYANRYRWWKKNLTPELVNHLVRQQELHPQTTQDALNNGEESA